MSDIAARPDLLPLWLWTEYDKWLAWEPYLPWGLNSDTLSLHCWSFPICSGIRCHLQEIIINKKQGFSESDQSVIPDKAKPLDQDGSARIKGSCWATHIQFASVSNVHIPPEGNVWRLTAHAYNANAQ